MVLRLAGWADARAVSRLDHGSRGKKVPKAPVEGREGEDGQVEEADD